MQTYLETQEELSVLLERAREDGEVRIKRSDGEEFVLKPIKNKRSALDVKGISLGISTKEIVDFVREGRDLFGSQLAFPIRAENGTFKTVTGIDLLEESIRDIVETEKGERVMRPEYGWPIRELIGTGDYDEISEAVRAAIVDGGVQIDHADLRVIAEPLGTGLVEISVTYSVTALDDNRRTVKVDIPIDWKP